MERNEPEVIKAVGAFGGGIGATGNVCGILLAGVTVISTICSRSNLEEKEDPRIWQLSQSIISRFEEMTSHLEGSTCREITQVDWKNRRQVKNFYTDPESRRRECIRLVGEMAYLLGEFLEKEGKKAEVP